MKFLNYFCLFLITLSVTAYTQNMPPNTLQKINQELSSLAENAIPAIVYISSTRTVSVNQMSPFDFFFDSPFFESPQRHSSPQHRQEKGIGSGFFISKDGYILTNYHVIENADEIIVTLHNNEEVKAKIVGSDKKTDIALLKIPGKNFQFLELGDSEKTKVGELVIALGNPFKVGITFTMGVVSAKGRNSVGIVSYEDFIQTDAAINPGNSGGPLINIDGKVIGINTAIFSRSGGNQGIGFAIPVNMVKRIKNQLQKNGKVVRAYLGVSIQDLTPKFSKTFGLPENTKGALVNDVVEDSPADKAKIKTGDIIIKINDQAIETGAQLRNIIAFLNINEKVKISLIRNKKTIQRWVKLSKLEEDKVAQTKNKDSFFGSVKLEILKPSTQRQYGIPKQIEGALITDIDKNGKAYALGFRSGDVILKINNQTITTAKILNSITRTIESPFSILLYRNGSTFFRLVE